MFDQILSILFPEHCYGCHKSGTPLCTTCVERIPYSFPILESLPCFAFFNYSDHLVQRIVRDLKYHRKSSAAKALAHYGLPRFYEYLGSILQSSEPVTTIIVPVPQHYTKTLSRGFNQSILVAQWLQRTLPKSSVQQLLRKKRATAPQAHAPSKRERMKNIRYSMTARRKVDKKLLYIIVDDVITTGSTVQEASRALRAAGARNICAVAIAHGYANS